MGEGLSAHGSLDGMSVKITKVRRKGRSQLFRLIWPLCALKYKQGREVWGHAPPEKLGTLRSCTSEAMLGPKMLLESPHLQFLWLRKRSNQGARNDHHKRRAC